MQTNLVQTFPELQKASLNGVQGLGYAEVVSDRRGTIHGVILFDEGANRATIGITGTQQALFEGTVYRDDVKTVESLPVEIVLFSEEGRTGPGATFVAKV